MTPKKPNFLIIGSAKCGTTTLAAILDRHPDCCFSRPKEVDFFQEVGWKEPFAGKPNPNYSKGWDWYSQAWAHYSGEPLIGEASPAYSDRTNSPQTAARIHAFNPNIKIIYMVREPLARQLSTWRMIQRDSFDKHHHSPERMRREARRGFESFQISRECRRSIWDQTRYHYQLEPYLELFQRKQVLVSFLEDWKKDQNVEVKRILNFLLLDPRKSFYQDTTALNVAAGAERHSALQRIIVKSRLRPLLRVIAGPKLWSRLAAKYAQTPYRYIEPSLTPATLRDFLDYVGADNQLFLKEWGKPSDYWTPAKVALLE